MSEAVEHHFKVRGCTECPWAYEANNGFVNVQTCRLDETCDNSYVFRDDDYPDSCALRPSMTVRAVVIRPDIVRAYHCVNDITVKVNL